MPEPREILLRLFGAALDGVEPGGALARALAAEVALPADRTWILAFGKAAHPLAGAAVAYLGEHGLTPAGGLVVGVEPAPAPAGGVTVVVGDHPLPGPGSAAAAEALETTIRGVRPGDDVWVLLSGGTSSLIGAPVRGITNEDLRATYASLLRSGLDIHDMNRVRKRISRWAGGRLAAALSHTRVRVFAISDVVGDDIASIGSGPCAPDSTTADGVRAILNGADLSSLLPRSVMELLERTRRGMAPETPKPADAAFRNVEARIIAGNRIAVEAAADAAYREGFRVRVRRKPIAGEAADCGVAIAQRLVEAGAEAGPWETLDAARDPETSARPVCYVAGGETTVTIREPGGVGGRCQELALAAARVLGEARDPRITLLAAGTDGRDGPTDAAGALVDNGTWRRILAAGRKPSADLARHDAYAALESAGALVRTGPTGTNVADLVIAVADRDAAGGRPP